ncbi:serine O-acetyltransferase EpsC [Saccharothrix saharensis]|uniref:serine O-acetyltransferase EpsC n=1 Tax=Saccharothrix saharensis TaxID=571190 RepID=UPI00369FA5E3
MVDVRGLVHAMREDLDTVVDKDPSVRGRAEAALHPHITALWLHRVAHACYRRSHRIPARLVALLARFLTGIEIHPGARIGRRFFIDHGAAVVIGETTVIGDDVMLYHQVTLGSVGWWRDRAHPDRRRHPTVEDDVVIGTNASVLGAVTVGHGSRIGAHSVLTRSVPPRSRVSAAHAELAGLDDGDDVLITGERDDQGRTAVNGARRK